MSHRLSKYWLRAGERAHDFNNVGYVLRRRSGLVATDGANATVVVISDTFCTQTNPSAEKRQISLVEPHSSIWRSALVGCIFEEGCFLLDI